LVITATSDPSVPEPAAWVMMLLGFAGLGFVGYRASGRAVELVVQSHLCSAEVT
jgi:PEP-CTERM motif